MPYRISVHFCLYIQPNTSYNMHIEYKYLIYTHIHACIYAYVYIYIHMCVCMCVSFIYHPTTGAQKTWRRDKMEAVCISVLVEV